MIKKVTGIFFSPTNNTKKSVEAMMAGIDAPNEVIDLTDTNNAAIKRTFGKEDFVIFGMPVYAGRIPTVARERLTGLQGNQTPCIVVATYGNRDFDDALLELADCAKEQGFIPIGAAALIGRHTYGDIQVDRPDAKDLEADKEFVVSVIKNMDNMSEVQIPGNRPYRDGGNGGKFRPLTSEACTECGKCIKECPVQAIAEDYKTINDSCIACFRCIRNCPAHAKNMDVAPYLEFAAAFSEQLKNRKENEYFL